MNFDHLILYILPTISYVYDYVCITMWVFMYYNGHFYINVGIFILLWAFIYDCGNFIYYCGRFISLWVYDILRWVFLY
jgi:hypothetical protein